MLIRLDYASSIGLAEQIAGAVRQSIRDGVLSAGEGLPAARALASVLGVNVHTVFRAYSLLRVAGVVEVRQGRGARVLPPPEELPKDVVDAIEALVRGAASRGVVRQQLIRYLEEMS
ncbi:GntR family transcriptional regulator [Diaminobutyricibacter tongyongensis]|uniref:GntR family transcriptional regulator n=2 Tax=Leifsonia tongyongensis TaxID=1268043 RepID=A0A6L9XVI5_9MICO|nr:GntR family transcriptional regulator [Diaminobutyricibacter tongyongensis]